MLNVIKRQKEIFFFHNEALKKIPKWPTYCNKKTLNNLSTIGKFETIRQPGNGVGSVCLRIWNECM